MANILENLNERQLQAVTAPEKSVLILAGAGSGKTRVLTTRIAWLLEKGACRTSEILAVTFTNKAAREMLTRLETMLPYDLRNMWVGTFHGLCNRILRRHAEAAGLPKTFQILDSGDQLSMVKRIMKANNVDTETVDPRKIQSYINWQKEHGIRSWSQQLSEDLPEQVNLYRAYEEACQREGVVDFGELLLRCYELLDRNEIVRSHYQGRFRHILVDEFQDTNVLQYRWLQVLAGLGSGRENASVNAVFAVGDDDQSIYAFRGANVGNMADFVRDFRTGERHTGEVTLKPELGELPILVKENSIIPLADPVEFVENGMQYQLTLRVYGSAPEPARLFADDGWSFDYEDAAVPAWGTVDADGTLSAGLGKRYSVKAVERL